MVSILDENELSDTEWALDTVRPSLYLSVLILLFVCLCDDRRFSESVGRGAPLSETQLEER